MRFALSSSGAAAVGLLVVAAACGGAPPAQSPAGSAAPAAAGEGTATHGDHNPHHGGVVLMKGNDLHYEVVLDPSGRAHHIYFTDALREALPASIASDVVVTIKGREEERIVMQIDDTGESWVGSGHAVEAPASATARVAFVVAREPYWIDIPFSQPSAPGPGR
jgi:hypothetical protein